MKIWISESSTKLLQVVQMEGIEKVSIQRSAEQIVTPGVRNVLSVHEHAGNDLLDY